MAEITAALVKQLRDATNVSMMDCKRALVEAEADIDQALKLLRERGMAVAAKKASRVANQGLIASKTTDDGKTLSLVEVNCETDFVARNENFIAFVSDLADKALATDASLGDEMKDMVTAKVAEIGENIVVRRNARMVREQTGALGSYIHLGGKVGVLLELGCEKEETTAAEPFTTLLRDLTLHVAASNPRFIVADEVPEDEIKAEREIYAKQVENKPDNIVEKIVDGKIRKYLGEICFVGQPFVKEPKQSITELLAEVGKQVDDSLTIRRFVRYQLGA